MKKKINYELEKIKQIFEKEKRGKILDLGCGRGDYSKMLKDFGFEVVACDLDEEGFKYKGEIEFKKYDLNRTLAFEDNSFDYVLLLEVLEHLKNPYEFLKEVNRILKFRGVLVISVPNILNLKSRLRFLFEGAFDYYRESPLDQMCNPREKIFNLHLFPYRYQELECLLRENGFSVTQIFTSSYENFGLSFLVPLIKLQLFLKAYRAKKKGGIDYSRINKILLSKELLFGRHLIIKGIKAQDEKNPYY